jgi:hypothetical protein
MMDDLLNEDWINCRMVRSHRSADDCDCDPNEPEMAQSDDCDPNEPEVAQSDDCDPNEPEVAQSDDCDPNEPEMAQSDDLLSFDFKLNCAVSAACGPRGSHSEITSTNSCGLLTTNATLSHDRTSCGNIRFDRILELTSPKIRA